MRGTAIFCGILAAVTILSCTLTETKIKPEDLEKTEVTVGIGSTPWVYAKRYCPDGVDIREYLTWVEAENGISFDYPIYPGQKIIFLKEAEQ